MSDSKLVWSDEKGDLRKKKIEKGDASINEADIVLKLRRLTSGKGRTAIEISGLPQNKKWCQNLAKDLKKKLGVGGAYKNDKNIDYIEIHGEKIEKVMEVLDAKSIKWKKIGG